ncbi:MAG TPA: methyltransferase domain-containing protein [Acidimicrobiales bacterium]|nr:methyltransferase domain-containing protein [Acidimicrobiales bacterium]
MGGAGQPHQSTPNTQGRVGFEAASDVYERGRPGYQQDLVAFVVDRAGIHQGTRVLDLAAGTGKFTRELLRFGARCVAVEPSASMREVLSRTVPGVPVIAGIGEAIPLRAGSMEAVVVAQAFHWFDPAVALPEIARVLRPGGVLSLVWNERDERDPVMIELNRMTRWDKCMPYPVGMDFSPIIDASHRFGPVTRSEFHFTQPLDRPALVDQVASRSYVRVLPDDERAAFLAEVAAFADTLAEPIVMPYNTQLFTATVAN